MKEILSNVDQALDDEIGALAEEFNARLRRGEKPTAQEYAEQYPHLAELILGVFPALEIMGATVTHESPSNSNIGTKPGVLGDYQIIREAGRGGMGVVYEAQQISLDRRVALKVLPFAAVLDERQIKRFHNEARAAAQLKHPNIVQVYGVGCERSVHFYAMEFVKGETLESAIKSMRNARAANSDEVPDEGEASGLAKTIIYAENQSGSNDTAIAKGKTIRDANPSLSNGVSSETAAFFQAVARIGADVADALDHAHVEGVVHRDIKPSNLMLDSRGKVWVTDFGLARIEADAGVTMTGDLLGTMRYMSPEQALAHRVVIDHRTDVYSLGVTLYELLALRPAFPQQEQQELLKQIAFEGPPRLKKLNPHIPQDLATIVGKAVERNPNDRYATAKAMADDLRRFLDRRPINARPPRVVDVFSKWSRRHWKPIAATLAALLLAAVTGMVMLERNRGQLAEANSNLAVASQEMEETNKELEALVHYTTGQYLHEKGDLRPAYREITDAIKIADRWEYGHQLARICEASCSWVPVARIAVVESPDWVRVVSRDRLGLDEFVVFRIGSRLEVHSIREGRLIQQRDLADQDSSRTADVLVTPPAATAPRTTLARLVHLSEAGKLTIFSLPYLERLAPSYSSADLERIASLGKNQRRDLRMAADATGSRVVAPLGRQVVVLDISDPNAVERIDSFNVERDVDHVQLSPEGDQVHFVQRGGAAYVRRLQETRRPHENLSWHWHNGHFLNENLLIGVRYGATGSIGANCMTYNLKSGRVTSDSVVEMLSLTTTTGKHVGFQLLQNRFRRTELSANAILVTEGSVDLKSVPTTQLVRAADLFPEAEATARFLSVSSLTKTIVSEHGSELVALRPPQDPVALSRRKIESIRWNVYQHLGELFVHTAGANGVEEEFALYDVRRLMLPENIESPKARETFRLAKPNATVKDRFVTPLRVTMNSTPAGDRLAVLWGEVDSVAFSGTVYRLEAYVYDKTQVADTVGEVAPIARIPISEFRTLGTRDIRHLVLAPSGNTILLHCNDGIVAYGTDDHAVRYRTKDLFPDRFPIGFAVAHDQSLAASGDPFQQQAVKIWDVEQGTLVFETKDQQKVRSMTFNAESKSVWIGWLDGSIDVHRLSDGSLLKSLPSAPAPRAISPTEDRIIGMRSPAGNLQGTRELVDSDTGATISGMVLEPYLHILNPTWYTPDGRTVTIGSKNKVTIYHSVSLDLAQHFLQENFPLESTAPSAWELNEKAQVLLTGKNTGVSRPAKALELAEMASAHEEASQASRPPDYEPSMLLSTYLDTLSLAQWTTGDVPAAIETQRRALALMPKTATHGEKQAYQGRLNVYQDSLNRNAQRIEEMLIDDFNDGDAEGWTTFDQSLHHSYGPGIFDASSGAYRLASPGLLPPKVNSPRVAIQDASSDPVFAEGFFRATIRADEARTNPVLYMRVSHNSHDQSDVSFNGYGFVGITDIGRFGISRIKEGTQRHITLMDSQVKFAAKENWIVEAGAVGEEITMKVWRLGEPEPASPQLRIIDSTFDTGQLSVAANITFPTPNESNRLSATFDDLRFIPVASKENGH